MNDWKYPMYFKVLCIVATIWFCQSFAMQFWALAQQTLISQSQSAQALEQAKASIQQKDRELAAERAKKTAEEKK